MPRTSAGFAGLLSWCAIAAGGCAACSGPQGGTQRSADAGASRDTRASSVGADLGDASSEPVGTGEADRGQAVVSRSLALTADGGTLWVVNSDADSVGVIDTKTRTLVAEILLGGKSPSVDPVTGRFDPPIGPRAIALDEPNGKVYVAAEYGGAVYVLDATSRTVLRTIQVGAEPVAVVVSSDGEAAYVVNHQSATITKIDTATDAVVASLPVGSNPWGASLRADGSALYVSHFLLSPGVTVIDTATFTVRSFLALPDEPRSPLDSKLVPNGKVRGAYAVVPRPGTGELWIPHLLLGVGTAQPALDFESTVFPTISRASPGGTESTSRITFKPPSVPGSPGNFTDSCSGPRDVAFTPDGSLALLALGQSEDVMVFDGETGDEVDLVRPLPSAMLDGILVDATGSKAYVLGRNTHNVSVLSVQNRQATLDGDPIQTVMTDPMPADLRLGQRLFYSANSAAYPVTQNFWVACASCHLEGRSDEVTWLFEQGPRDTPSNAGGPINTGFLFRLATRNDLTDYDETIRVEQGGAFDRTNAAQLSQLQALAKYVNFAIPLPPNPNAPTSGTLNASQMNGQAIFVDKCATCHPGPFYTDSGAGNPTLDLNGTVTLHDVGTCVTTGAHPDVAAVDIDGNPRSPCAFDTPTLRGVFATPPYLHDGSAATLEDVVTRLPAAPGLTDQQKTDLVNYLLTL